MEHGHVASMDGSDWSLGTGSSMNHVAGPHDAQMDFNGNLWITHRAHHASRPPSQRIDGKTGAVKHFKLDDQKGDRRRYPRDHER